jgi:hypothetical protein
VRVGTNFVDYGWISEFSKPERPVENQWYILEVRAIEQHLHGLFDGQLKGSFSTTNHPSGRLAVGSKAQQLGIWEPQRGYYFIDDDEYSYYSPVEADCDAR